MANRTPSLDQLIESYVLCCTAERKSPKTIEWYSGNLRRFARHLANGSPPIQVEEIGVAEARDFILYLQTGTTRWETSRYIRDQRRLSPFSVQGYARTIKAFWSWLRAEGIIDTNPMSRLRLPKVPTKVMPTFSGDEIQKMLSLVNPKTYLGARDQTIIIVLLDTGIRLSELTTLDVDDVDLACSCFLVRGKGDKERMVLFGSQVRRALRRYTASLRPEPALPDIKRLFLSERGLPLRPRAIQSMVSRLSRRAGIVRERCSPHTFRHTFAREYLMRGGDVFSLQRILGHSSLEVVRLYVHLAAADISELHRRFSPVDNMRIAPRRRGT